MRVTPRWTTPGNVTPIGPFHPKCSTMSATTSSTASGVPGLGVRMRWRRARSTPRRVSTGAPLMPLPPMSMPSMRTGRRAGRRRAGAVAVGSGSLGWAFVGSDPAASAAAPVSSPPFTIAETVAGGATVGG